MPYQVCCFCQITHLTLTATYMCFQISLSEREKNSSIDLFQSYKIIKPLILFLFKIQLVHKNNEWVIFDTELKKESYMRVNSCKPIIVN